MATPGNPILVSVPFATKEGQARVASEMIMYAESRLPKHLAHFVIFLWPACGLVRAELHMGLLQVYGFIGGFRGFSLNFLSFIVKDWFRLLGA